MSKGGAGAGEALGGCRAADGAHNELQECPVFRPSEAEFQDPIKYISQIRGVAGIHVWDVPIVPPASWDPPSRWTSAPSLPH